MFLLVRLTTETRAHINLPHHPPYSTKTVLEYFYFLLTVFILVGDVLDLFVGKEDCTMCVYGIVVNDGLR
jgi:hypothetical protein